MVGLDNPLHIALILVVVVVMFGAKRLPEMGRGIGEGMRGFTRAIHGDDDESRRVPAASRPPAPEHDPDRVG